MTTGLYTRALIVQHVTCLQLTTASSQHSQKLTKWHTQNNANSLLTNRFSPPTILHHNSNVTFVQASSHSQKCRNPQFSVPPQTSLHFTYNKQHNRLLLKNCCLFLGVPRTSSNHPYFPLTTLARAFSYNITISLPLITVTRLSLSVTHSAPTTIPLQLTRLLFKLTNGATRMTAQEPITAVYDDVMSRSSDRGIRGNARSSKGRPSKLSFRHTFLRYGMT
jgi:hypothetical protein